MVHLPLVISENNNEGATPALATATPRQGRGLPPRPPPPPPNGCVTFWCRRRWTAERIAHCGSNGVILLGCLTALAFAIYAVKDVTQEYTMLTMFIVGGTVFGGGCLMALTKLPRNNDAAEQFTLLSAARRLMNDAREFGLRETVVRLLQNNMNV